MAKIWRFTLTGKVWQFILFKFYLFKKNSNSTHFREKYKKHFLKKCLFQFSSQENEPIIKPAWQKFWNTIFPILSGGFCPIIIFVEVNLLGF